ncbi:hypothetical protein EMIT0373P_30833 [Pseudomonas chlororaphis]
MKHSLCTSGDYQKAGDCEVKILSQNVHATSSYVMSCHIRFQAKGWQLYAGWKPGQ